jgi:hypothetical protein
MERMGGGALDTGGMGLGFSTGLGDRVSTGSTRGAVAAGGGGPAAGAGLGGGLLPLMPLLLLVLFPGVGDCVENGGFCAMDAGAELGPGGEGDALPDALPTRFFKRSGRRDAGLLCEGGGRAGPVFGACAAGPGGRACTGGITVAGAGTAVGGTAAGATGFGGADGGGAGTFGAHLWSPSWSRGTGWPQSEHLTDGRICEIRGSGLRAASIEVIARFFSFRNSPFFCETLE